MPTPFYHLFLGEALLKSSHLPDGILRLLLPFHKEFLFGNTAPDVQVISGQPRQETHFFNLPLHKGDQLAWEKMLNEQPLLQPGKLFGNRGAFIAGYLCHLQADWLWATDIFSPVFGLHSGWVTFQKRLYYHNVLRAYLDRQILPQLTIGLDVGLSQVEPNGWLPFVLDRYLTRWRDYLYPQLKPGAQVHTVEIFSYRQRISANEYYALLDSDERMTQEVFAHLPIELLENFEQRVLEENILLLSKYLAPSLQLLFTPN
jgi:hypothetical protein